MRTFELVLALLVALAVFVALELIGMVVKFALIAAALGFVAGLVLGRSFRRS
jgi:hypothetical protein